MSTLASRSTGFFAQTDMRTMQEWLSRFVIIDIGVITACVNDKATVQTFRVSDGERITYTEVEVLYMGGATGYVHVAASGSLCLIIRPLTSISNAKEGVVNYGAEMYSREGMKCIPITAGFENDLFVGFDTSGSFIIGTDEYKVTYTDGSFSIMANGSPVLTASNGRIEGLSRTILSNGIIQDVFFKDNKVTHAIVHSSDGTMHVYSNPSNDVSNPDDLGSSKWDTEIKVGEDIEIANSAGDVKIKAGNNVEITNSSDGVKIKVGETVSGEFTSSGIKLVGPVGSVEIS